jgi:hypothetical protein
VPTPISAPTPAPSVRTNYALAASGGAATASSQYSSAFPISALNDGDRTGTNWGAGGGWNDSSMNVYGDWVEVAFSASKLIDQVDVFTLQDNYASPSEPTAAMTFSQYGITAFEVQYWTGFSWMTVPGGSVSWNNNVWRRFTFAPIETAKIRVQVNAALAWYSRIVEVEAWGIDGGETSPAPTPTLTPVLSPSPSVTPSPAPTVRPIINHRRYKGWLDSL